MFDPTWADRALHSLMESGMVESNALGQYRLPGRGAATTVKCGAKTMFIAPHLAEILEKSGNRFATFRLTSGDLHAKVSTRFTKTGQMIGSGFNRQ